MTHDAELLRFAAALIYSGIFWATAFVLTRASAENRRLPFFGVGLAVGVLIVMAHLFVGVVARQELFAILR